MVFRRKVVMSSESKKRKADCDTHNRKCRFTNGFALKWKGKGKGWMFFNSSQRTGQEYNPNCPAIVTRDIQRIVEKRMT